MNKKLFEIREIKNRKSIPLVIGFCLLAVLLVGIIAICTKSSFLQFHNYAQYKPLNDVENNKGFYGKVNVALARALEEGSTKNKNISDKNLNTVFPRLKFYCPRNNEQAFTFEEVRLVEFIPDTTNKDEVLFYHNSDFMKFLRKQNDNLEKQYFIIDWDKTDKSIKSITIDSTLANVPLQNASWKGVILMDDPFLQVDKNVMYLMKDNMPIPLFSSNRTKENFESYRNTNDVEHYKTIAFENWKNYSVGEYENMFYELNHSDPHKSKSIKIKFNNEQYVNFLNSDGKLQLQWQATGIELCKDGKKVKILEESTDYYAVDTFKNVIQLHINTGSKNKHIISIVKKPFDKGSVTVNNLSRVNMKEDLMDLSVKQQFANISNNLSDNDTVSDLHLVSNPFLSKYLEDEMKKYYRNTLRELAVDIVGGNKNDEFQISVCLMDISTGEIIAAPFYSNRMLTMNLDIVAEVPNYNFTNHDFGSTFKPLLSFAAAKRFPALKNFSFLTGDNYSKDYNNKENTAQILGYKTDYYGPKSHDENMYSAFWHACADRKTFLATSHDNYPIALTMLALSEKGDKAYQLLTSGNFDNAKLNNLALLNNYKTSNRIACTNKKAHFDKNDKTLDKSEFARLLEKLYDVKAGTRDAIGMIYADTLFWKNLKNPALEKKMRGFAPNSVFMQLDKTTDFRSFERFVIGQGNNQWNNVKLAEAYSRLLSKKKVNATFVKNTIDIPAWLANADNQVWLDFMKDWREAVKISPKLLTPAYNNLKKAVSSFDSHYYFYCKTGTPQENNEMSNMFINGGTKTIYRDEGVFCFGITNQDLINPKGIVGVVYIRHLSKNNPGKGIESSAARNFFSSEVFHKIMFYNKNRFNR